MTDTKVTLDDAVKHISTTLSQHADSIRRLQDTLNSLQPQLDTRLENLRSNNQQEIRLLETNLTTLFTSKDNMWTQVSDNLQSLNEGLVEVKNLFTTQRSATSSRNGPPPLPHSPILDATPSHDPSQPNLNVTTSVPYSSPRTPFPQPHTIVLPPPSSLPTFSGKMTERPRQFLIRVEEYACTITHWSRETLLRGISQFLRDDAFEWYCQLHQTHDVPTDWNQFALRFLAQFHSPIRAAQQEQAWLECKQAESETINQFVVRLRSLWLEQKPTENDSDFTKHLFCKMRPDMLNLMNFSRSSSLEHIILEAQKVEEILYLRAKEQRQRELQKNKHVFNTVEFNSPQSSSSLSSHSSSSRNVPSPMSTPNRTRVSPQSSQNQQWGSTTPPRTTVTCWNCYETGHYSPQCPLNNKP